MMTPKRFLMDAASREAAEFCGVLTPKTVIGFIKHPVHRITIRRSQFGNKIGDLVDHRVHASILSGGGERRNIRFAVI